MDRAYLISVEATLISGDTRVAFDVFRADSPETACNYAQNIFIKEGAGVVVYGDTVFVLEAIATLKPKYVATIDLSDPENHVHAKAADIFEQFLKAY